MNILLINHYAGSLQYGMEYRPYYLAREWVRLGHQVTVVGASFSHLHIRQPRVHGKVTEENIDGIRFVWLKTPAYQGNGLRRAWNVAAFTRKLWRHRSAVLGPFVLDAVIASSPHPFPIFPARRIASEAGAKLVFEVRDLWPLTLIELYGMSRWNPFIRWLQHAEDFAYRNSDLVVATLPAASSYMQSHGMAPEKFVHVSNGIDVSEWQDLSAPLPSEHAECLSSLREAGRFIVGYAGGHQPSNSLQTVIEAAELMRDTPVTFVLVGHGSEKDLLLRQAKKSELTNVVFLPSVPKTCVPALLDPMDVLYIGLRRQPIFRYGISPNKLFDYMMAAKPVIHAVETANDLVAEADCGISCPPEDPRAIVDAVTALMTKYSPEEQSAMGKRGRDYILQNHVYSVLAKKFLDALNGNLRDGSS